MSIKVASMSLNIFLCKCQSITQMYSVVYDERLKKAYKYIYIKINLTIYTITALMRANVRSFKIVLHMLLKITFIQAMCFNFSIVNIQGM